MIENGPQTISDVIQFLGLELSESFAATLPPLKRGNYNKWQKAFTSDQKNAIGAVLNPMLRKLGYDAGK
jgi:hypothetical protein